MPEVVRERGGTPVRTRVGHSFIKAVMAETGAAFGGEHSAHYYFRDNFRADSGCIAALIVLEQLSAAGVPLSELRRPFERYAASGEINFQRRRPARSIEVVAAPSPAPSRTASTGSPSTSATWWFNLRPSNTEPLLRLNLEAPTPDECDAHVAEIRAHHREGMTTMALDPQLLEILACPEDKGPLLYFEDEDSPLQPAAKRRYRSRTTSRSC